MRNNRFPIVVVVAGSTTAGQQLTEVELNECFKGCDETLRLERDKKLVLAFIESMMHKIAPNLCAMVGSSIAAQLIGLAGEARVTILSFFRPIICGGVACLSVAGGLQALAQMPACNVQVMGQQKNFGMGLSNIAASNMPHIGVLFYCDLVQVGVIASLYITMVRCLIVCT